MIPSSRGLVLSAAHHPLWLRGRGWYYNDDNDYDVRGGHSFSQALLPKAQVKWYNDYYDGQGGRSFSGALSPMAKEKGGYFDNNDNYYLRGCCSFGPPHQSLHGTAFDGLVPSPPPPQDLRCLLMNNGGNSRHNHCRNNGWGGGSGSNGGGSPSPPPTTLAATARWAIST